MPDENIRGFATVEVASTFVVSVTHSCTMEGEVPEALRARTSAVEIAGSCTKREKEHYTTAFLQCPCNL